MNDDRELLLSFVETGSDTAFAALVKRYVNLVYSAALRRSAGNRDHAEEVTQKVFVNFARRARHLSPDVNLSGWLYTCSRNAAVDALRAEHRRAKLLKTAMILDPSTCNPAPGPDWEKLRPILDQTMDELSPNDREVILLRYFENRSYPEMAGRLSIAADTARMRVERAMDRLRHRLARRGIDSTGAALGLSLANNAVGATPQGYAEALAGSALSSAAHLAPLPGSVALMSLGKLGIIISGIAVAASVGLCTRQFLVNRSLQKELAAASQANATALRRVQLARQSGQTTGTAKPTLSRSLPAALRGPPQSPSTPDANARAMLTKHPELRELLESYVKSSTDNRYREFFLKAGLSQSEISRFEAICARQFSITSTVGGISYHFVPPSGGDNEPEPQAVESLLGPERTKQLAQFNQASFAHTVVDRVAAASSAISEPLSFVQIAALRSNYEPLVKDGEGSFDWGQAADRAAVVLTPSQLEAFRALREQAEVNAAVQTARRHE